MKRACISALCSVIISFLPGSFMYAQDSIYAQNMTFEDWDLDENHRITRSEFIRVFKENYAADWNVVDDAHFDDEDFFPVTFRLWDVDDDDLISEEEWIFGYDNFFDEYIPGDFVALDKDGDGFLEYEEYYTAPFSEDYYIVWDMDDDGNLSENELARMVFNNWDVDDSGFIEEREYIQFDRYYLDI